MYTATRLEQLQDGRSTDYGMRTSQSNVNSSSTNLSKLGGTKQAKGGSRRAPVMGLDRFASFQLPLTPPLSNASTPVFEKPFFTHNYTNTFHARETPNPPVGLSYRLIIMCAAWYLFSIVSSNTTKMILTDFKYPITLTQLQFLLNSVFCIILFAYMVNFDHENLKLPVGFLPDLDEINSTRKLLTPTRFIISTTFPMGIFQLFGHITSHKATSLIPVSMVHIIKALSPMLTVLIYRVLFKVEYRPQIYFSLLPLVAGIMIVSYRPSHGRETSYINGLFHAFISMTIFVSQNIFSKKRLTVQPILPKSNIAAEKKLDKVTMLLYCSIIGFLLTSPIYLFSELNNDTFSLKNLSISTSTVIFFNGLSHFLQSLLAFQILGSISPINYSIANIMKRIIIIIVAFLFEKKHFATHQIYGLLLTIFGLYSYNRWGMKP